jgi:hypothetical protein
MSEFEFQPEHDGSLSREAMVMQALGAASVCWEHPERAGVFDATRAKAIGDKLLAALGGEQHPDAASPCGQPTGAMKPGLPDFRCQRGKGHPGLHEVMLTGGCMQWGPESAWPPDDDDVDGDS